MRGERITYTCYMQSSWTRHTLPPKLLLHHRRHPTHHQLERNHTHLVLLILQRHFAGCDARRGRKKREKWREPEQNSKSLILNGRRGELRKRGEERIEKRKKKRGMKRAEQTF